MNELSKKLAIAINDLYNISHELNLPLEASYFIDKVRQSLGVLTYKNGHCNSTDEFDEIARHRDLNKYPLEITMSKISLKEGKEYKSRSGSIVKNITKLPENHGYFKLGYRFMGRKDNIQCYKDLVINKYS